MLGLDLELPAETRPAEETEKHMGKYMYTYLSKVKFGTNQQKYLTNNKCVAAT